MRIFRWLDPAVRTHAEHFGEASFDWLAVAVQGEDVAVTWVDIETVELDDGTLLVAGRERGRAE